MINSTCVWVDNTAAIIVAMGNDFTHETVKHATVKVLFPSEVCTAQDHHDSIYQDDRKYCRYNDQASSQFAQHRDYALGIRDAINIVTAAVAEILRRVHIYV